MKVTVSGLSDVETTSLLTSINNLIDGRICDEYYGELKIGIWRDDA